MILLFQSQTTVEAPVPKKDLNQEFVYTRTNQDFIKKERKKERKQTQLFSLSKTTSIQLLLSIPFILSSLFILHNRNPTVNQNKKFILESINK